ncbi:T9SS type A sorting domain-containing protein [candidate division KSB1 bacterium]|nr:T9SS type A sorting domain-containing protein [candidate division KSB1 bacterium]
MRHNILCTLSTIFLLIPFLYAHQNADNPVLDIRLSKEQMTLAESSASLILWIEVKTIDGSSRQILNIQDALAIDKQLRSVVTAVNVSDWYFSSENYRISSCYTSQQGVLEFHVLHLDGQPLQSIGSPSGMWTKLARVEIVFANESDFSGKVKFYENTPRFNVRAKRTTLPGTETIHHLEHLSSEITVSSPGEINVEFVHAGVENGTVQLAWILPDLDAFQGVYVFRAAERTGPFLQVSPLITCKQNQMYSDKSSELEIEKTYFYRLGLLGRDGNMLFSNFFDVDIVPPSEYRLGHNFPNPFNPETRIPFVLKEGGQVKLKVYNLNGQHVRTLINQPMQPGRHAVEWDGRDELGRPLSSGMYIYRIQVNDFTKMKKMQLMR